MNRASHPNRGLPTVDDLQTSPLRRFHETCIRDVLPSLLDSEQIQQVVAGRSSVMEWKYVEAFGERLTRNNVWRAYFEVKPFGQRRSPFTLAPYAESAALEDIRPNADTAASPRRPSRKSQPARGPRILISRWRPANPAYAALVVKTDRR